LSVRGGMHRQNVCATYDRENNTWREHSGGETPENLATPNTASLRAYAAPLA
jgi:hypothetical protein